MLTLEWEGNAVNDMIADSVLAIILQAEASPASVKGGYLERREMGIYPCVFTENNFSLIWFSH